MIVVLCLNFSLFQSVKKKGEDMAQESNVMKSALKASVGYMMLSAALGIILGLIMLYYPGGTMTLMQAAFQFFQIILTIFALYYAISEGAHHFKAGRKFGGILYFIIGALTVVLIWLFNVGLIYFIVALFLILMGISDIVAGIRFPTSQYFLVLLGAINIIVGLIILKYPLILPLLIAWYVLFWGISRLLLSIQMRKFLK